MAAEFTCWLPAYQLSYHTMGIILSLTEWKRAFGVLTSTMALGSSSALNSCSMESIMFFQPSLSMLPCRWARSNTVLAAVCALLLLPNTVGRFSTDCIDSKHTWTWSVTTFKVDYRYNWTVWFKHLLQQCIHVKWCQMSCDFILLVGTL